MITSFTTSNANAASTDFSPTIREAGKYIVVIKEADTYEHNGFQFVRFLVETTDKRTATIELCVAGGQSNWQAKLFDALCVCANVKDPKFVPHKIKNHRRGIVNPMIVQGYRCQELEGKRLGVLFQLVKRDYIDKKDGSYHETSDVALFKSFNPDTELTASEIINGVTTPANLANSIEACMKERDLRKGNAASVPSATTASTADTAPTEEEPPF